MSGTARDRERVRLNPRNCSPHTDNTTPQEDSFFLGKEFTLANSGQVKHLLAPSTKGQKWPVTPNYADKFTKPDHNIPQIEFT